MKKILLLCLCFVLITVATVGGTIAVSQNGAERRSAILSSAVSVALCEEERLESGGFAPVSSVASLASDPSAIDGAEALTPTLSVPWRDGSELLFWDALDCARDKIVSVQNTSKEDVYIRTVFAFEDTGGITDQLYLNVRDREALAYVCRTEIDGVPYQIYTYTYEAPLGAGEISAPSLLQYVFGKRVTGAALPLIGDAYDILIAAEAVQTEGFDDASTALNAIFGEISAKNHPWA